MIKVLVIDDDRVLRTSIRVFLEMESFQVIEASNGIEGITKYRDELPELVMADMLMPEMNGIDVVRNIKKLSPKAKVIAISGSCEDLLEQARHLGAVGALTKPFSPEELLSIIHTLFPDIFLKQSNRSQNFAEQTPSKEDRVILFPCLGKNQRGDGE